MTKDAGTLGREAGELGGKTARKAGSKAAPTTYQGILDPHLYREEALAALSHAPNASSFSDDNRDWFVKAFRVAYHQALGGGYCRAKE